MSPDVVESLFEQDDGMIAESALTVALCLFLQDSREFPS